MNKCAVQLYTDLTLTMFLTHPIELLLQFFICVIDAELFKTVAIKSLKPAQTENTLR